jgi:hypothetical protein
MRRAHGSKQERDRRSAGLGGERAYGRFSAAENADVRLIFAGSGQDTNVTHCPQICSKSLSAADNAASHYARLSPRT